ncbi:MAG: hypothetical protein GY841_16295 [FCB group bacterium]|nr:hypothetical protein [FCB group bacterium]
MLIRNHDTNDKVLVIAEIGNAHEGGYLTALMMICAAAQAGADAVKFQRFIPELYDSRPERIEKLKRWCFDDGDWEYLAKYAHICGVAFICTPFDLESAEKLAPIVDAFKISSGDCGWGDFVDKILSYKIPTIVSTGGQTESELGEWVGDYDGENLAFLHCISGYPVPDGDALLHDIREWCEATVGNGEVGYSDHTEGITAPIAAVALGARIIEKHFTINSKGVDAAVSLEPSEFAEMVHQIRRVEKMLGDGEKRIMPCEEPVLFHMHRSIRAKGNLPEGHEIKMSDLTWTRPADGLPPGEEDRIVGVRTKWAIRKNATITEGDVE